MFFIYLITFIVAACSILYELLLANTISLIAGSTVVWYSVTIGVYLGAMGIGAFLKNKIFPKNLAPQKLFKVEIYLSVIGGAAALVIPFSYSISVYLISLHWGQFAIGFFFAVGMFMIFLVGLLSGVELPLLMDIGNSLNSSGRKISNRILGADYFGSLAGAILFPLLLIPNLSGHQIGFLVAIANIFMAFAVLFFLQKKNGKETSQLIMGMSVLLVLIFGFSWSAQIEQFFAKKYYYYLDAGKNLGMLFSNMKDYPDIERIRSPYQQIDIMEPVEFSPSDILVSAYFDPKDKYDQIEERMVYLNGDWQFATYVERVYHEYFVHVPMGVAEAVPRKVLVLGGGDGMLVRELLKYNEIEQIVHVELDSKMIELAKEHPIISSANKKALLNERVDVVIDDAFHFVQNTDEEFDAVFIDFPVPVDYNTSKIYSREFYSFVEKLLIDEGFVSMYAPGIGTFSDFNEEGKLVPEEGRSPWFQYYHTLKASGFETIVPYFSRLEVDNINAWDLANSLVEQQETKRGVNKKAPVEIDAELIQQERNRNIEKMMRKHVMSLMEGFIIAKKDKESIFGIHDHGVKTMLNQKRMQLAFDVPFTKDENIKWEYVNSIMKPTLPHLSVWRIRFPYSVN